MTIAEDVCANKLIMLVNIEATVLFLNGYIT